VNTAGRIKNLPRMDNEAILASSRIIMTKEEVLEE
jgi:hypothetical protein